MSLSNVASGLLAGLVEKARAFLKIVGPFPAVPAHAACVALAIATPFSLAGGPPPGGGGVALPDAGSRLIHTDVTGFPTTEITVEMWIRDLSGNADAAIFSYAAGAEDNQILLIGPQSLLVFKNNLPGVDTGVDLDGPGIGAWAHVSFSWRSIDGLLQVVVNGQIAFTTTHSVGLEFDDGGCLVLGEDQDSLCGGFQAVQAFIGEYLDVRLWSTFRSEAEIAADFDQRLTGSEAGLVSYWPMDEGVGSIAFDYAGTNNLSLVGNASHLPADEPVTNSGGFSYQGLLKDAGELFTGNADLRFGLFDTDSGGTALATVTLDAVPVAGGLFNTTLDFGDSQFDGSLRWLEIEALLQSGTGYETLTQRQAIGWTPQSVFAFTGTGGSGDPGSIWSEGALGLYYNARPLGIGTPSPTARLGVYSLGIPAGRFEAIDAPAGEFFSYGASPVALDSTNSGSGTTIGIRGSTNALFGTGV